MSAALTLKRKFIEEIGTPPLSLLDEVLEWVDINVDPEIIYGWPKLGKSVAEMMEPDEVFPVKRLEQWAYDNGFKKFE